MAQRLRTISKFVAIPGLALWVFAAVQAWECWSPRFVPITLASAATAVLAAVSCGLFGVVAARGDRRYREIAAEHRAGLAQLKDEYEERLAQLKDEYDHDRAELIRLCAWLTVPRQPIPRLRPIHPV